MEKKKGAVVALRNTGFLCSSPSTVEFLQVTGKTSVGRRSLIRGRENAFQGALAGDFIRL
jgi:hypothetical protein